MSRRGREEEEDLGLLWRLPLVKSKQFGKIGPAFGFGAGCGAGFGFGLMGGIGPGIPGLQIGFGLGIGCGFGVGFGYGVGRGVAYDDNKRHSNVRKFFQGAGDFPPTQDEIGAIVDDLILNTKKLVRATSKEIDKWRR